MIIFTLTLACAASRRVADVAPFDAALTLTFAQSAIHRIVQMSRQLYFRDEYQTKLKIIIN